jgi:hypothetical protein
MFRGSLHFHLAVLGEGNRIVNRLNDFPYSSFVIVAKGKTLYLLVLYETNRFRDVLHSLTWNQHLKYSKFGVQLYKVLGGPYARSVIEYAQLS